LKIAVSLAVVALVFGACVGGALGKAQVHRSAATPFRVSHPFAQSCAQFFGDAAGDVRGWSGTLDSRSTYSAPVFTDVKATVRGSWTDPDSGLSYRLAFSGAAAGPELSPNAAGSVEIRRSDNVRLRGTAQWVSGQALLFLNRATCA
jgi:hypothetical protein